MLVTGNSYLTPIVYSKRFLSFLNIYSIRKTSQTNHKNDPFHLITRSETSLPSTELTHFKSSYLADSVCSNLLKLAAKKTSLHEGKQLHTQIIKSGYCNILALQNQLLHVYVRCKEVSRACKVFDEMSLRNVVTWNTLICGKFNSCMHLGFHYFKRMLLERVSPDYITLAGLFRASLEVDDIEIGQQLHCYMTKSGGCVGCFVNGALVDMYAKFGFVEDALRVFDSIIKKDLVLWNIMVSCYVLNGFGKVAFEIFNLMRSDGIEGDNFTLSSLLTASAEIKNGELGQQVHNLAIKLGFDIDIVVASSVVDMYAKNENIFDSRKLFDGMKHKNVISWNTIIVGYALYNNGKEAVVLVVQMLRENFKPDESTFSCVISACGNSSLLYETLQVHAYAIKTGSSTFLLVGNALINSYSKCGTVSYAYKSFTSILDPDLVSWTSVIGAYGFNDNPKKGLNLFDTLLSNGSLKLDKIIFLVVLCACSHGGLVKEGLYYFNMMINEFQVVPGLEHYTCLVDLLGRTGFLDEALEVLSSMPVGPDTDALGAYVRACKEHGEFERAKWAIEKVLVLEPCKAVNYTLLSNMYASIGSWFDAARVREVMKDSGCFKIPSYSRVDQVRR